MIWVLGVFAYVVSLAAIVRFFQFVSDADRSIEEIVGSNDGLSGIRRSVANVKPISMRRAARPRHVAIARNSHFV